MTPGVEIELADGNVYTFPPLSLASLEALQKEIESFRTGVGGAEGTKNIAKCALHSLSLNYPQITLKDVRGQFHENEDGDIIWDRRPLLSVGNFKEVMDAVMDVSGIKRKGQELGKAQASQSNGAHSTVT
jgi:hypothetical protein